MTEHTLHQFFRYDYESPIHHLDHRLVAIPPAVHGSQRRVAFGVNVTGTEVKAVRRRDRFGNQVVRVSAPLVEESIRFDVWARVVTDVATNGPTAPAPATIDRAATLTAEFTRPSRLTSASASITGVASDLAARARTRMDLAERICSWVHAHMTYAYDVTTVKTTAAEALNHGAGVCQDYSHLMLAIARAAGMPARYVSGHLAGEGGSHAWVEVMTGTEMVAFDPTHNRVTGDRYLTVATGRDYADVAPTSGTFSSGGPGRLSCGKRLDVSLLHQLHLDLAPAGA